MLNSPALHPGLPALSSPLVKPSLNVQHRYELDRSSRFANGLAFLSLFNSTGQATMLYDLVNPGRTFTKAGPDPLKSQASQVGLLVSIPGGSTNDGVVISPSFALGANWTMSAMVFGQISGAVDAGVLGTDGTGANSVLFVDNSGTNHLGVVVSGATGFFQPPLSGTALSGFNRIVVTCNGLISTCYLNGTLQGTTTRVPNFTLSEILGASSTHGGWPAPTADLFIWTRTLSAQEVAQHVAAPYAVLRPKYGIPIRRRSNVRGLAALAMGAQSDSSAAFAASAALAARVGTQSHNAASIAATRSIAARAVAARTRISANAIPIVALTARVHAVASAAAAASRGILLTASTVARSSAGAAASRLAVVSGAIKAAARGMAAPSITGTIFVSARVAAISFLRGLIVPRGGTLTTDPRYIARPMPRSLVARLAHPRMMIAQPGWPTRRLVARLGPGAGPQARDIGPIDANETPTITWDFTPYLLPGTTIVGIVQTTCINALNGAGVQDPTPSIRLIGTPLIGPAPAPPLGSGRPAAAVRQQFTGGVAGARYSAGCLVLLSDSETINEYVQFNCGPSIQ